MTEPQYSTCSL